MKPVTDPALLAKLNAGAPKPVEDPTLLGKLEYGIDFDQPVETVRGLIAKLPEDRRQKALDTWADAYVAKENKQGGAGQTASNVGRTLARGSFVGPFLDELNAATAGVANYLSGGAVGAPYDETLAYNRARDRYVDKSAPGLSTVGKIAGGVVGGGAALRAGGGALGMLAGGPVATMAPAATALGRVGQGAAVGGAYGAASGFGEGEGGLENRVAGAGRGALVGAALGGALSSGVETVRGVRNAMARQGETGANATLAERLPGTVDEFADSISTGATGTNQAIQRRTFDIIGEEMERSGGNHLAARDATIRRLVAEHGVAPTTAREQIRRLTQVHADSPLLMAEYPAVAESNRATRLVRPGNVDIAEASQITPTRSQATIDYLANQGGKADDVTRTAVMDRQAGLGDWMRGQLQKISPGNATLDSAESAVQAIRDRARTEYQAAYTGPQNTPRLVAGLQVAVRNATQRLGGRGGEHATALRQAIDQFMPAQVQGSNARGMITELQAVQDARAAVRGMMESARRSGRDDIAAVLQPFYKDVTRAMASASPMWRQANARWADQNIEKRALEMGQLFSEKANLAQREAFQEFARLAPEAKDMVRIGWIQRQFDRLDGVRDTNDVSKLFDKREFFNVADRLFGRAEAVQLARAVRDAEVANVSKLGTQNSATHRRGQVAKEMDSDLGIVAAADNASVRGVKNWLMEKAISILRDRRNVPMAQSATTPMNDVFAVARNVHNMRRAQQRLQQFNTPPSWPLPVNAAIASEVGDAFAQK